MSSASVGLSESHVVVMGHAIEDGIPDLRSKRYAR